MRHLFLCALLLASCHKKTDAERAAEERAACRKRVEKSLALVPYRSLKTVVRASAVRPPPPELEKLIAIYGRMKPVAAGNALEEAAQMAELGVGLFRARSLLHDLDEDRFPTLWQVFVQTPPLLPWYSSKVEHLALAQATWIFEVTLNKDPVADILFYELDRAEAEPTWPPPFKVSTHGARGLAYMNAGYHYAAEEELNGYLDALDHPDAVLQKLLGEPISAGGPPLGPSLQIAGHLARAWNRFALERDEPANQDLEAALNGLDKLGVQNEVTDWGWALLSSRRGRYDEAAKRLDKLAQSPYLSSDERAQIKDYAAEMQKKKGAVLFGRERAQIVLVRAVIARAGGLEKVLGQLFGDETGHKIYAPLAFLNRLSHALGK